MTEIPEEEIPQLTKIQLYCAALYNEMDQNCELVETSQGDVKTWTGYIGATADSVGIPEGVRTRVIRRLADIGSIYVVEQGRRNVPTIIALLTPPTGEAWETKISQEGLTPGPEPAILAREVRALRDQLGGVNLKEFMANIELRLSEVEVAVRKLQAASGEDK